MSLDCLVERELFRAVLFRHLVKNVAEIIMLSCAGNKKRVGDKEISQLVLRYVFNKIPFRLGEDDPVFITTPSPQAVAQVERDLAHFGVTPQQLPTQALVQVIEHRFAKAAAAMRTTTFKLDAPVILETAASIPLLRYKGVAYTDYARLGKRHPNPEQLPFVLALGIRYEYLQMANQGLACDYAADGLAPNAATEAFASPFNHYFDDYFSAFPDLEAATFGSRGSFFDIKADPTLPFATQTGIATSLLMVNPPFDESVMARAVQQVLLLLEHADIQQVQPPLRVRMILPAWRDFVALSRISASKYVTSDTLHKKGTFPFINHMSASDKHIFPCDLHEVWLQSHVQKIKNSD